MPPPLRVPWVIDAAGTWMRAADAPAWLRDMLRIARWWRQQQRSGR